MDRAAPHVAGLSSEEARARLVMLNEERIRLIQMDLARAQVKLDVSQRMFLAEEDELPDPDEDQP